MWRTVPSYPRYEASDEGLIRSTVKVGKAWPGVWDVKQRRYAIYSRHYKKPIKVARMICEAFHGPAPEGKPFVLHIDEDSRNNRPHNLVWGTAKENLNAPGFIAYCKGRTGDSNPYRKGRKT